jgi:VanZ family protein
MKIYYKYLLLVVWMIVIFLLSNEVAQTSSGRSSAIVDILTQSLHLSLPEGILTFLTRKSAHIIGYFVLGMLLFNVVKEYTAATKRIIILSILFAFVYSISDEIHQLFVPGRSGEIRDVLIDTIAASAGIGLYAVLSNKHKNAPLK